jgi:hypothetical protein
LSQVKSCLSRRFVLVTVGDLLSQWRLVRWRTVWATYCLRWRFDMCVLSSYFLIYICSSTHVVYAQYMSPYFLHAGTTFLEPFIFFFFPFLSSHSFFLCLSFSHTLTHSPHQSLLCSLFREWVGGRTTFPPLSAPGPPAPLRCCSPPPSPLPVCLCPAECSLAWLPATPIGPHSLTYFLTPPSSIYPGRGQCPFIPDPFPLFTFSFFSKRNHQLVSSQKMTSAK